jgi:peptide methionine sulfoxide reductase msrA/msrB
MNMNIISLKNIIYLLVIAIMAALLIFMLKPGDNRKDKEVNIMDNSDILDTNGYEYTIFAGGCFWCIEQPFEALEGVLKVESGYTGGHVENPTYEQVSSGNTGHYEAVRITYNPSLIDYSTLLDVFWKQIDPTDPGGQFADRGSQYKTAIFYNNAAQKQIAQVSKIMMDNASLYEKPIVTEILPLKVFYPAEDYHQDYYAKNSSRYCSYKAASGREAYIKELWGNNTIPEPVEGSNHNPPDDKLQETLTPLQCSVIFDKGTEPPFDNEYWNNKEPGLYVDVVSGEPLFSSSDKYDSGTGWPSFLKPVVPSNIVLRIDDKILPERIEVRSKHGGSHLGHVFFDGPEPTGLRFCINSAALRFIPEEKLEEEGYGDYLIRYTDN